jgi:hypothetical protein
LSRKASKKEENSRNENERFINSIEIQRNDLKSTNKNESYFNFLSVNVNVLNKHTLFCLGLSYLKRE